MGRMRAATLAWLLLVAAIAAVAASLTLGSSGIDAPWERLAAGDPLARTIVWDLRLPRALAAFGVGVVLALAGVLMQALLRNPLADPYVLGISGGAAVGALGLMLAGGAGIAVDVGAAAGAFGAMLLVFAIAHGPGGWTTTRLLLTGNPRTSTGSPVWGSSMSANSCSAASTLVQSISSFPESSLTQPDGPGLDWYVS